MRLLFHAISYVFFPGTMAVVGFWCIVRWSELRPDYSALWLPAALFLLAPVVVLFVFLKIGWITDIHVSDRKQRSLSYPIAIVFALVFVILEFDRNSTWWVWGAAVCVTLVCLLITNLIWMKASAHMAGTSGFLVLTLAARQFGQPLYWVLAAFAICILVYIARKGLSAHSHKELVTGFCLGFIITFVTLWL